MVVRKNTKKKKAAALEQQPVPQDASIPPAAPSKEMQPQTPEQIEDKQIQELLALAKLQYTNLRNTVVKDKKKELDALDTLIKEFMGPFMLIGYDINNNPVEMVSASSTAEYDALLERLRRVMYKINQNLANSGGNDPYGFNN